MITIREAEEIEEYLIRITLFIMAVFIDSILFTQVLTEFTAVTANYPGVTNPVLIAFLKSRLALYILFGCVIANTILIYKILTESYLVIMLVLETAMLLHSRPKHLKG